MPFGQTLLECELPTVTVVVPMFLGTCAEKEADVFPAHTLPPPTRQEEGSS